MTVLDLNLAAYSPTELDDLAETVAEILRTVARPADLEAHRRISQAMEGAIARHRARALRAGTTATVLALPVPG